MRAPISEGAIFQSGTFVEGWAVYTEQVMAEAGYGGAEVKMQQLKMRLRAICNAILDQSISVSVTVGASMHIGEPAELMRSAREALDRALEERSNHGIRDSKSSRTDWKNHAGRNGVGPPDFGVTARGDMLSTRPVDLLK